MTHQEFVVWAASQLQTALALERSEAHLRARLLLDSAVGTRYAHLISPAQPLSLAQEQTVQKWLNDALRGRPIPYILGRGAFYGLDFEVDERVLIPRPETELLVETALQHLQNRPAPRVADLGTGSGAIAVSIAHTRRDAQVWALDVSPSALEIAARNAAKHKVCVQFLQGDGDWLSPLRPWAPFDAIASNPPYIPGGEIETLAIGVREFEPRLALDGGDDGLDPFRAIAAGARALLLENGFVAVELGAGQFAAVRALFEQNGWKVEAARRDLAGIERVLVAAMDGH